MGFLNNLFGSNKKLTLQDNDLGSFNELSHNGDEIIWKDQIKIFGETIVLYMSGNSMYIDITEKTNLFDILKNETTVESEINEGLQEQYRNADKHYSDWRTHFNCITMSTIGGDQVSINFEEKGSLYQFNVFLTDCKATNVSIDS